MKKKFTPPLPQKEDTVTHTYPEAEMEQPAYGETYVYDGNLRIPAPFWQKFLIYCVAWLLIIFAVCCVMWDVMKQYEEAQPWYAIEEYVATSGQSAFFSALTSAYGEGLSDYESLYDIASVLSAKYSGKTSYKKLIREYTYDRPVYLIHSGEENLLKVTLQQGGKTGFAGFAGYTVRNVELVSSDMLSFKSYALVYPKGATVKVNGKAFVGEETDTVTVFGSEEFNVCMLENFFSRPEVKVSLRDVSLTPNDGNHFIFDYPESKLRTLTISAPEGANIYIDALRVSDFFITGNIESEPDRYGATTVLVEYTVPTVAGEGIVTADAGGRPVVVTSTTDTTAVRTFVDPVNVTVPSDATLYANGDAVDTSLISDANAAWRSDFEGVNGAPAAAQYIFADLYSVPEFSASLGETELVQIDDDGKTVFIMPKDESLKELYEDVAYEFMNAYLYYTTQGYSHTRANLDAVKAHVASPSPLYTNLERSYIGYYYIAPQKMTVEYMEADNFVPYGEDAFTCDLSYRVALSNWVGNTTEENTVRIAFIKRGGEFKPANMLLISE